MIRDPEIKLLFLEAVTVTKQQELLLLLLLERRKSPLSKLWQPILSAFFVNVKGEARQSTATPGVCRLRSEEVTPVQICYEQGTLVAPQQRKTDNRSVCLRRPPSAAALVRKKMYIRRLRNTAAPFTAEDIAAVIDRSGVRFAVRNSIAIFFAATVAATTVRKKSSANLRKKKKPIG